MHQCNAAQMSRVHGHAYSLPQYGDRDTTTICVTCKLRNKTINIIVVSIYMASDENTPSVMLEKLYRYCSEQHLPLIVASDTNSHHPAWGCNEANRRGQQLFEFLTTTDLEVANSGNKPTFCVGNKGTIIDVTLVSKSLLPDINKKSELMLMRRATASV